jgi:hypothetical protein
MVGRGERLPVYSPRRTCLSGGANPEQVEREQAMNAQVLRESWFSRGSVNLVLLTIPIWAVAGIGWGVAMTYVNGGGLIVWLISGVLWGAAMWFFMSLFMLFLLREQLVRLPELAADGLGARLAEAVKPLKFSIDQTSPHSYVCQPTRGLPRLLGTTVLYAQVHQGGVDLTGPASVISLVKKNLLTAK